MEHIARMRFVSAKRPEEKGELVLTSEKTLRIEPSDEMIDELAHLEEQSVYRSRALGLGVGGALIAVGALFALAGWVAGRIGGRLRETISEPKPVEKVRMFADPEGGVHLLVPGNGPQTVTLYWAPGETDANEVAAFMASYRKLKGIEDGLPAPAANGMAEASSPE